MTALEKHFTACFPREDFKTELRKAIRAYREGRSLARVMLEFFDSVDRKLDNEFLELVADACWK